MTTKIVGEVHELTLAVWPAVGFQVNFFRHGGPDVLFDIDVRELQGQARLDLLSSFLREVGQAFGAPVVMRGEGDSPEFSLFHYDPVIDGFVLDAEPLSGGGLGPGLGRG